MVAAQRKRGACGIRVSILLVIAVILTAPTAAQAMTAEEAFADGNRLFRDDLYWAALLRYQQAADAGMNTPLLHYNVGIAHYKARQYERARKAFLQAAKSPRLAPTAHYNLGLTAFAAGDNDEALGWLRRARDQEQNKEIRKLASRAIDQIRDLAVEPEEEAPVIVAEERPLRQLERDPRPFSEIDFYARAGFGSDDNVYRSPSVSYVDISDPDNQVPVDPVIQSGSFIPVSLGARYLVNSFEHESFFARYRGSGRFYSDRELSNADEYIQELAIGTEFKKDREGRQNRLFSAFTIAQHDETYYDPDTGLDRLVNDVDIGDRLSYLRYGPEIWTRQSWERFSFNVWAKAQLWNYEDTEAVPEYDHEYFRVGTSAQYRFTQTSLLRLTADTYRRYFTDRPSFELDGTQPVGNPSVEYRYVDLGVAARQKVTGAFWFGVSYVRTDRMDAYIGYNDYFRDSYGAEFRLRFGDRFRLKAEALYRIYNFANAFAFNNPAAGRKTLETATGNVRAVLEMGWNMRLVGEYEYKDVTSNDTRIAYERNIFLLSLQWDYD